jgi:hypothetical protein
MAATIQNIEFPTKPRALDTSGNNNHGKIYSGRALEFDGVTDYLQGPDDLLVPFMAEDGTFTVACWIKIDTAVDCNVWHMSNASADRVGLSLGAAGEVSFSSWDGVGYTHVSGGADGVKITNTTTWYRVVCVMDSATKKLYINGILQTGDAYAFASPLAQASGSDSLVIGTYDISTLQKLFTGKMSDFQSWDAAWSENDVNYDYANPESLALNASGTALTESNLKVWYPMQDGHRGQQSYILDGANTGPVDEKIVNGDFSTAGTMTTSSQSLGWSLGNAADLGTSISNGELILYNNGTSNYGRAYATDGSTIYMMTIGQSYKLTYTVSEVIDAPNLNYYNGEDYVDSAASTLGTHSYVFTTRTNQLFILKNSSSNSTIKLSNVSVKAINDKHHATTVFYGDTLWDAAASTNGNVDNWQAFDSNTVATDSGMVKGTFVDSASGIYMYLNDSRDLSSDLTVGRTYQFQYDIKVNAGSSVQATVALDGGTGYSAGAVTSTEFITQTIDFVCAHETLHFFYTGGMGTDEIVYLDNFSLKEVGVASGWTDADQQLDIAQPALQSYNELAWVTDTGEYVEIADHNDFSFDTGGTDDPFSLSAWIYQAEDDALYILTKGGYATYHKLEYRLYANSSQGIYFYLYDGPTASSGANNGVYFRWYSGNDSITKGKWHHIVATYSGTTPSGTSDTNGKIYIDGVNVTTTSQEGGTYVRMSNQALSLMMFKAGTSGAFTGPGSITEAAVWADELSAAEVVELYNDGKALDATTHSATANIKGYWRNNGLSTWTNVKNPGTHDATVTNITETLLIPQGVDGSRDAQGFIMNRARNTSSLNLTNNTIRDYVDLGSVTTVVADGTSSFVMWIKPDDLADNVFLSSGGTDWLRIQDSTTLELRADGVSDDFTVQTIVIKEWVHVAFIKAGGDTNEMSVYVNGELNGTASTDTETSNEPFDYRYIGSLGPNSGGFRGQIDGFLVYSDVLSGPEVLRNYNATKGSHRN